MLGAVYPRWGSLLCPPGTTTLYDGFIAGGSHDHYGGGANQLCMHGTPEYPTGYSDGNEDGNLLYGTEYEHTSNADISMNEDLDAACVMCQRGEAVQVYTQWGRTSCSSGHHTEYSGIAMGEYYTHTRRKTICVDPLREVHHASSYADNNNNRLYPTEMRAGASDESLYPEYRELACAVCSAREAVHVRWGSRTCTGGASYLTEGFIALSKHDHRGGGANALCMHGEPQYPEGYSDSDNNGNLLYGATYKQTNRPMDDVDGDAACVLCARSNVAQPYVAWGRRSCENDDTLEYVGVVMGGYRTGHPAEHICVHLDRAVQVDEIDDRYQAHLYTTETRGGFDPSIYPSMREVSCATCSPSLASGAVYTRWGSRTCPSSARMVYEGFMAGGGGGFNHVCLHSSPQHPEGYSDASEHGDALYGVQCARAGGEGLLNELACCKGILHLTICFARVCACACAHQMRTRARSTVMKAGTLHVRSASPPTAQSRCTRSGVARAARVAIAPSTRAW